jgi:hypothetical protein
MSQLAKENDSIATPEWVVRDMVEYFNPQGSILDPCSGDGIFLDYLPKHALHCEIKEGRDFYNFHATVDWIISNPPYSIFSDFLRHSFEIADNIVYLIPANKPFNSDRMMREIYDWGGIKEIRVIAPGSRLKFPIGFGIAAVHFVKGYKGSIKVSFAEQP